MQGGPDRGVPAVVWAVEPLPANLTVLRTNLRQHGVTKQASMTAPKLLLLSVHVQPCLCGRSYAIIYTVSDVVIRVSLFIVARLLHTCST